MSDDPLRGLPWERRPVVDPGEAKAAALRSMHASRQSRSQPRRKVKRLWLTPGGLRYLEAELRWAAHLRRKAERRSGRDRLELAEVKRARRALDQRAYTDGSDPEPLAGHSQAEVDFLGRKGEALWIKGRWAWPVTGRRDLINCLAAWRQLRPGPEASTVKAWLKQRAIRLRLEMYLLAGWTPAVPS